MPEFYLILALKIFSVFFGGGGGAPTHVSYTHGNTFYVGLYIVVHKKRGSKVRNCRPIKHIEQAKLNSELVHKTTA